MTFIYISGSILPLEFVSLYTIVYMLSRLLLCLLGTVHFTINTINTYSEITEFLFADP